MWGLPVHMPCPECGQSVLRAKRDEHECDPRLRVEYELFQLHEGVERFDADFEEYLASPAGSFDAWYAEHRR